MANDVPDWTPDADLIASLNTLDADVKALTAGFGSSTTVLTVAGTIITLGGPVIVLAATPLVKHYLVSAYVAWWSNTSAQLRGYVRLGVSLDGGVTYYNAVLTPERPSDTIALGAGVPSTAVNQAVYAYGVAFAGAPNSTDTQLAVSLVYFDK